MDILQVINTLTAGFMFAIWSKKGVLNLSIKMIFLILLIVNILRLAGKL